TEEAHVGPEIARRLTALGAKVHRVRAPATKEEAEATVAEARAQLGRVDLFLHLSPLALLPVAPADADGEAWNGAANVHVKGYFRLAKLLHDDLSREGARTVAVTALGGFHGLREARGSPLAGGVTGLTKALAKEWPKARVTALDLQGTATAEQKAEAILRELNAPQGPVEVGVSNGERVGVVLGRVPAPEMPVADTLKGAHLVVSGGAQGITAEILKGISPGRGLRLTLLGRTALVANAKQLAAMDEAGLKLLREKTTEALKAKGERVTPVKLEQTLAPLLKAREVQLTLDSLEAAGAQVHYAACDVTDPEGVTRAVAEGRARFGPVTGVIHAAGLEESKLLPDKTHEAFDRIFDTKVKGLHALARATRDDPVFFHVSFGSVAGRFGNAGQVDYSAANDVLAKAAHLASAKGHDARLVAWTAWSGVGMATKGSIMQVLQSAGVEPLPVQEGVARFLREVASPGEPEVVVAKALGALAAPTPVDATPLLASRGLLQTLVAHEAGARVVARARLDPANDKWLADHAVDGVPYLPGVCGLEAFAEAATLLAHGTVVEARNVQWEYPVKFLKGAVEFTVEARVMQSTPTETLVHCVLQTVPPGPPGAQPQPRTHFRATLVVSAARRVLGNAQPQQLASANVDKPAIYARYFHGPTFQVLKAATGLQGTAIRVIGDAPAPGAPNGLASPMAVEGALQAAGLWGLAVPGIMSLPHAVQRVEWDGLTAPGSLVYHAVQREARQGVTVYDVDGVDAEGTRRLRLTGLELITTGAVPEEKRLPLTPFPAAKVEVEGKQA
ncbi:MAG TPA: SDR family oxidoreductase, partial [Candidatus Thermoplasmatota archaeon]|nr:SDR family oxidoreductase [Candidatus Thermoplasmatota archaeon]